MLREAGYHTGLMGKWHSEGPMPCERGCFAETLTAPESNAWLPYFDPTLARNGTEERIEGYVTDILANEAESFIERNKDGPFGLIVTFNAPHVGRPRDLPPAMAKASQVRPMPPEKVCQAYDAARAAGETYDAPKLPTARPGEAARYVDQFPGDTARADTAATIAALDEAVGRILDTLERTGASKNTLVVFFSDNGGHPESRSENGALRGYKWSVYEGGVRVPFFAAFPGVLPAGARYAGPVSTLDIFPTVMELAGIQLPPGLDGVSLLPYLKAEKAGPPHESLFFFSGGRGAMIQDPWKLVVLPDKSAELYDLSKDLGEAHDLAATETDRVQAMMAQLKEWKAQLHPAKAVERPAADAAERRPNILFILTDDQRFNALHAAGCPEIKTPAMDRLVAEGCSFSQASIMGAHIGAVCVPSRSMIMTGKSLFRCRGVISPEAVTLPQLLRDNGYSTFITGKWHNDTPSLLRSFESGKAIYVGGMSSHLTFTAEDLADGQLTNKRQVTEFDAEVFANETIDFLKDHPRGKPFFAYLAFKTPHEPRIVPERYHQMYDAATLPLPPNFMPKPPFDDGENNRENLPKPPHTEHTEREIREQLAAYYAATSATDDQIDRVLEALDELGLARNTIVVFTGDNGLAVGQHGLMGKQNMFDHSVRVPLVLRGPGVPAGKCSEALCYLFDLYPTLAAMAGVEPPAAVDGKDLGPVVRGEKEEVRDATLHAYREVQRAVRTRDAKLIEYLVEGVRTTQLFDLKHDPWETKNLADDAAHAGLLQSMRSRMELLRKEYDALPLGSMFGPKAGPRRNLK